MIIGAIKVKDGLFIGDELASKDLEFIIQNKVTRIVNCAAKQLLCVFENYGVSYLKFNWLENDQVLSNQQLFAQQCQFILKKIKCYLLQHKIINLNKYKYNINKQLYQTTGLNQKINNQWQIIKVIEQI